MASRVGSLTTWMFGCELGLYHNICDSYKNDRESRGAKKEWRFLNGSCACCVHRIPANEETREAEEAFQRQRRIKEWTN